ncbi:unnamed protein product [Durusdinium trenchii]|uniref:Uncharacterized protein n=1 Tax=Durusdinium trenchii TaxID=1381693 RepID=A0ABP0I7G3_9DINO
MVSFFSLGFVIALVTAGATRMDRSEEVQDESTGTSECSDWGRLGHWGKCCTSKCNGQEDRIFKGSLAKQDMGDLQAQWLDWSIFFLPRGRKVGRNVSLFCTPMDIGHWFRSPFFRCMRSLMDRTMKQTN